MQLQVARAIRRDKRGLWPGAIVPYNFSETMISSQEKNIRRAMEMVANKTCKRFVPYTDEHTYIQYMYRDGCFVTSVGKRWGAGPQNVDIGCGCGFGAAIHEICHALGMWHERSRPDRDDYVRVLWDNIPIEKHHNYRIRNVTLDDYYVDSHGIPYDYASIMHGGFSKEGGLPTMEIANREWYKEQGYPALGSTGRLSLLDAA